MARICTHTQTTSVGNKPHADKGRVSMILHEMVPTSAGFREGQMRNF